MRLFFFLVVLLLIGGLVRATVVSLPGLGIWFPTKSTTSSMPPTFQATTLNATGQKFAWIGKVNIPDHSTSKNIARVGFNWGTVVTAGGSGYVVSLEDVELSTTTAGLAGHPDSIVDQQVAVKSSTEIVSNSWERTSTFNSFRTVNNGDLLAVVVEFDSAGRLGADSIQIRGVTLANGNEQLVLGVSVSSLSVATAWTAVSNNPILVLEFDDGTVGTLEGHLPWSAINTHTYNSGSTFDEAALVFTLPVPAKVDALRTLYTNSISSNTLTLYQGTTVLQSVNLASATMRTAGVGWLTVPIPETTLSANTSYYVGLRNLTATNLSAYSFNVSTYTPNIMKLADGGLSTSMATRKNLGAWTINPSTGAFFAGVRISALDNGAGGGTKGYPFSQ